MIFCCWLVIDDGCVVWFNDVVDGVQCVVEVFCVIFLVVVVEQCYQFVIEVDFFQCWEEVILVILCFIVVSGWDIEQQDVVGFQVFFVVFGNVVNISNIFIKLFLNYFCNIFGVVGVVVKKDVDDCYE